MKEMWEKLEGKLTLAKLLGIDRFLAKFFKNFWIKRKYIILHALNES